jgi:hypothetical protein
MFPAQQRGTRILKRKTLLPPDVVNTRRAARSVFPNCSQSELSCLLIQLEGREDKSVCIIHSSLLIFYQSWYSPLYQ